MKEKTSKMETYLIQRGNFEKRDFKKGIDSIVLFQYMGSSEFEWGALPKSLKRIRRCDSEDDKYVLFDISVKSKELTVFCKPNQKDDIELYLNKLANREFSLKEYSDFDNYVNSDSKFNNETDFWWDIDNDLMFWKKDISFESEFKTKINP